MSDEPQGPSRAILWFLRRVSSREAAEAAVGDVFEELAERRAAGHGPRWPRLWLNGQALGCIMASVTAALPRVARSFGLTLRDATRALRRAPAHAIFILLILTLGVAAGTVTFSVVDAVVFRPLPFDHSDELVMIAASRFGWPTGLYSDEYWAIHDRVPGLEGVETGGYYPRMPVSVGGGVQELLGASWTAETFRVLRLRPLMGRAWSDDDERRGVRDVALIGYEFWQSHFGGDPDTLGRTVDVFGRTYRIVGVMPAGVGAPDGGPIAVWVPRTPPGRTEATRLFSAVGRLKQGVSIAQVTAQVQAAVAPLAAADPSRYTDRRVEVQSWRNALVGDARGWLLLVFAAVMLVVLIACVNVANVMLTRSSERAHDLAVRASLGASRRQLALSLVTESLLLSGAASTCALVVTAWGLRAVKSILPPLFRSGEIAFNGRVFTAALLAALATGVLFGAVPAWQASRTSVVALLKDAGAATTGRRRWRSMFLIAEIACVGALLVVSTLFIASFIHVATLDLGFDRSHLLAAATVTDYTGTVEEIKNRLARIPGITGVAAVNLSSPPLVGAAFGGAWMDTPLQPVDVGAGSASVDVETYRVTPDYFAVAGMPFRRGATWSADTAFEARPMVIDEVAARRLIGDRNPIGLQVRAQDLDNQVFTVVGVVPYARALGPDYSRRPSAYVAMDPTAKSTWVSFLLRTSGPPGAFVKPVQAVVASFAPPNASGGSGVHVLDDAFWRLTATRRFNALLMSSFALFAMLIGAAGIYAVMSSVIAQQTREIGVRIALGATSADIRRRVLAQAGRHVLIGLAVGLPAAWWLSRGLGALFFEVRPTDLSIYVIVAVVLAAVGLIAAIVPARRAAHVDPIVSLRAS